MSACTKRIGRLCLVCLQKTSFFFFFYGVPALAGTDHKALETIAEKGFAGRSPRLKIQYDLQLKYIEQPCTEQAFCELSTELNSNRNRVLCACKDCLDFFFLFQQEVTVETCHFRKPKY